MSASPPQDTQTLRVIGRLDDALYDLDLEIGHIRRRYNRLKASRDELQSRMETHTAVLGEKRRTEGSLNAQYARVQRQRDQAQRALDAGTQADAAQRQIDACTAKMDDLETELLMLMDDIEEGQAHLSTLQSDLADAQSVLEEATPPAREAVRALQERKAALESERSGHHAALPADLQRRHDNLAARHRTAIAWFKDNTCQRCQHGVPLKRGSDAVRGLLVHCDGCGRWLLPANDG